MQKLKTFQPVPSSALNFAARVVAGTRKRDRITPVLQKFGWPRIRELIRQRDCLKVYKAIRFESTPVAVRSLFVPRALVSARATRATERDALQVPRWNLTCTKRSFQIRAITAWNALPLEIIECPSIGSFKSNLQKQSATVSVTIA